MFSFLYCKEKSERISVISVEEVSELINNNEVDFQLIDVRTEKEFQEGHLKNAENINITDDDFKDKVERLNKNQPVYVYCRSGKRSAKAAEIMKKMGFIKIYDMERGFLKWTEKDYGIKIIY